MYTGGGLECECMGCGILEGSEQYEGVCNGVQIFKFIIKFDLM